MQAAIKIENISKQYRIGKQAAANTTLRDLIAEAVRSPIRRWRDWQHDRETETLWALRDINFEVQQGETVGIIGRNGAGKSTLLKILSRITKPTSGCVEMRGRVGSLLEVGTGFHGELSGRENIYLNGAILGMRRAEITTRFDEIVSFAEMEKFIDTPVKFYSSGMYMRLAFAVAAHLEPEILIVDEVLAVGDIAFQRKCLNKMKDVSQHGRTVLFVSHDLSAIARICKRAVALHAGQVVGQGNVHEVVSAYLTGNSGIDAERRWENSSTGPASDVVRLRSVRVVQQGGNTAGMIDIREPIGIEVVYQVLQDGHVLTPNCQIYNDMRVHLFTVQDVASEWRKRPRPAAEYVSTVWIPGNFMSEGSFFVNVAVCSYLPTLVVHFNEPEAVRFDVFDPMEGTTSRGDFAGRMDGVIRPLLEWETVTKA